VNGAACRSGRRARPSLRLGDARIGKSSGGTNLPSAPFCARNDLREHSVMGKALILWMLGVPGVVVILLLVTHVI
jgi:hypothetical protein